MFNHEEKCIFSSTEEMNIFSEQKCKRYQKALRIGLVNYLGERLKIHFSFLYCPVIYASKKAQHHLNVICILWHVFISLYGL